MNRLLLILMVFFYSNFAVCQGLKTYTGVFEYGGKTGSATYTYLTRDGKDIKQGAFSFSSKLFVYGTLKVNGNYDNDLKVGNWTETRNWSTFNNEEHLISDVYMSRVQENSPFCEITKKHTFPYIKGKVEGKESVLLTRKETWSNGKKIMLGKKDKIWKNGFLSELNFELSKNNIKTCSISGKYITLNDNLVYDGEWNGIVENNSAKITYDRGVLKSALIKNISTGEIIKKEEYENDKELIEKYADINNISVGYDGNSAKLILSKIAPDDYEFEVIINTLKFEEPDNTFSDDQLRRWINYTEAQDSYNWNNLKDEDWVGGISKLSKKYLSKKRENFDFQNIYSTGNNAIKIFNIIDEKNINFIGDPDDNFNYTSKWEGGIPSYYNKDMYTNYLFYKGEAKKVINLYKSADSNSFWKRGIFVNLIAKSLIGDTIAFKQVFLNNLNKYKEYSDDTANWCESLHNTVTYLMPYIENSYSSEKIQFLNSIPNLIESTLKQYISNVEGVKVGPVIWMKSFIDPRKLNFNYKTIDSPENVSGFYILSKYLGETEIKKVEQSGWKLPNLKDLRDLFARNLNDYSIDGGNEFLIGIDENRKLFFYNRFKDTVLYPDKNSSTQTRCLCKLIKK